MFRESSGNYLSPVHHHLEACQPLSIIHRRYCVCDEGLRVHVLALSSLWERVSSGQNCVFVLTGFITDNIVCSSLLCLHIVVHIKPPGSRRAVFVLLCFSFHFRHFLLTNMVCIISGLRNRMLEFSSNPKAVANYFLDQCLNSLCTMWRKAAYVDTWWDRQRQAEGNTFGVFCCLFQF